MLVRSVSQIFLQVSMTSSNCTVFESDDDSSSNSDDDILTSSTAIRLGVRKITHVEIY